MVKEKVIIVLFYIIIIDALFFPTAIHCKQFNFFHDLHAITYHTMIIHFYYMKRLSPSYYFFSLLHQKNYHYQPCNVREQNYYTHIDSLFFFHSKIRECFHTMRQTQSLNPAIILLEEIKQGRHINDTLFMHEFFLCIFTIHKQILLHECKESSHILTKTTLNTILEISETINQLPIAEILNAIDMLVKELPPFLEKYEFYSKTSWKAWFKKYWWVPPVFTGWFGLKILLSLQRPQFYYSSYLSPKPQIPIQPIITNDPALLEIRQNNW